MINHGVEIPFESKLISVYYFYKKEDELGRLIESCCD